MNCVPLSEVTVADMPNLETQCEKKTWEHVEADISFRGIASSHLVVRSMM